MNDINDNKSSNKHVVDESPYVSGYLIYFRTEFPCSNNSNSVSFILQIQLYQYLIKKQDTRRVPYYLHARKSYQRRAKSLFLLLNIGQKDYFYTCHRLLLTLSYTILVLECFICSLFDQSASRYQQHPCPQQTIHIFFQILLLYSRWIYDERWADD